MASYDSGTVMPADVVKNPRMHPTQPEYADTLSHQEVAALHVRKVSWVPDDTNSDYV